MQIIIGVSFWGHAAIVASIHESFLDACLREGGIMQKPITSHAAEECLEVCLLQDTAAQEECLFTLFGGGVLLVRGQR